MRALLVLLLLGTALSLTHGAEVRIRGLRTFSETEALDFMGGRLTFIKSRPASPSRADDAAFILERLLQTRGFTEATVTWSLPGGDLIELTVSEGPPSLLGTVQVAGIEDPKHATEVENQFRAAHKAQSQLETKTPYLPNQNALALTNATQFLQSRGYWDAEVSLADAGRNPATGLIEVRLTARPGVLHRLAVPLVEVSGTRQPELERRLASLEGRTATADAVRKARNYVEKFYRNHGYQLAVIEMFASQQNGLLALLFRVDPGRRYSVGNIEIVGAENVQPSKLEKRFSGFRGQHFNADEFEDEIRELYGTGAFESVRLESIPRDDGTVDITIRVEEAKPDGYYAYGGLGTLEGFILGAGYYHRNLFGNLWNFTSGVEFSGIGILGDVRVTEPRFLGYDLRLTPRAYALTRSYDGYDKSEGGVGVELAWDLDNDYSANLSFYSAFVSTSPDGLPRSALGPTDYFVHRLAFEQSVDKRNNVILPTNGYFLRLNNEFGFTFDNDSVSYIRTDAQLSIYQPVFDNSHIAFNAQAGLIIPTGNSDKLPIDMRYFLGGASTVRSFRERDLGPMSNGYPRGGEAYWIANLEYIHTLKGLLNGVVFLDAGNLNESFEDFGSGRTNFAAGLGLRFDLPIGPVRFEYGHNLNPGPKDHSGAFHFAIGTTF